MRQHKDMENLLALAEQAIMRRADGLGLECDINKTIELWEAACKVNPRNYDVMFKLAHLYSDGIEMEPDYKKALHWWYQLAENDCGEFGQEGAFAEAMYQLACYYYEGKGVRKNLRLALRYFKNAIDLFLEKSEGEVCYLVYDRESHAIKPCLRQIEGEITISDEPDFVIHARKVLMKHGYKSVINHVKKAAEKGDEKAVQILKEVGIEFDAPAKSELSESKSEAEDRKRKTPIQIAIGQTVMHELFGEGVICEADDVTVCVEFTSVGRKNFLNPDAFVNGCLILTRHI